jgi:hypothetical protein
LSGTVRARRRADDSAAPAAIAAGYEHTCVLLAGGDVACWGRNGDGELGVGSSAPDGFGIGTGPDHMGPALRHVDLGEPARTPRRPQPPLAAAAAAPHPSAAADGGARRRVRPAAPL